MSSTMAESWFVLQRTRSLVLVLVLAGCGAHVPRVISLAVPSRVIEPNALAATDVPHSASRASVSTCTDLHAQVLPLIESGRVDDARTALQDAGALAESCVIADWLEARLQQLAGNTEAALVALDRVALATSGDAVRGARIATLLAAPGEMNATRALMFCQDLPPDDVPSRTGCAVAALRVGDRARADGWLRESVAIAPTFAAWMDLGSMALDYRGYAEARAHFTEAIAIRVDDYDAILGLALAYRGLGDADGARALYERALGLRPERAEAYFDLGVLYADYGDGTEASLNRAVHYYRAFVSHAGDAFAPQVADVTRECARSRSPTPPAERGRRPPRRSPCLPGRIQAVENWDFTHEMARMQADIAAMQAQIEAQARPPTERDAPSASPEH